MPKMVISIDQLLKPPKTIIKDRNVKGFALHGLWIPFLKSAVVTGEANISPAAMGAPLRDKYNKDGTPKLNEKGERVRIVEKEEIYPAIKGVMDNFAFALTQHAQVVQKTRPAEWKSLEDSCQKAGDKVREHEDNTLASYLLALEQAQAAAQPHADTQAPVTPERELVPA